MANNNFVVKNGLEVGGFKVFAGNGTIVTSGSIESSSGFVGLDATKIEDGTSNVMVVGTNGAITSYTGGTLALTIDTSQNATFAGDITVTGDLTVSGTTTTVNSTTLDVADLNITVASGAADSSAADGAGLTVDGAGATITYAHTGTKWVLNKATDVLSLLINGTAVTSTAAELNILDGVTSTAAELNILDGVTSTAAELNILDGVTATTAELNKLDGYTGGVTELNYLDTLHATGVTDTEFDYLDGVTSNIQTQLNTKAPLASPSFTTKITTPDIDKSGTNGVGDIGQTGNRFGTVYGLATSAQYADLAEKYEADADYEPGTVVHFGGEKEVSMCDVDHCQAVAGVVSTAPAYRMNDGLEAEHTAMVALQGRVPCKVTGTVAKGDMMVSAGNGKARAEANPKVGSVIGKALEAHEGEEGVIEVVVGKH